MANYDNVSIASSTPASGLVRMANSNSSSWTVHSRDIEVGLAAPTDLTYTEYKLWGYGSYPDEASASGTWATIPASGTVNITLDDEVGLQQLSARFRDASLTESSVVTASGVIYSWTEPSKNGALTWVGLTDEGDQSTVLRSAANNTDITFSKANIENLKFHARDFSGMTVVGDTIAVASGTQIWKLLQYDTDGYTSISKTFGTTATPLIKVDTGNGYKTLTTFSGAIKADVTGDYLDRIDNYSWTPGTKELTFDAYKFSTYGFATINALTFEQDSVDAGYINTSIDLKVKVFDTNGEGVENAPVTFSGSGDNIGSFSANPVYTDSTGVATATLNLDTLGTATYDAVCDGVHTATDQVTYCYSFTEGVRSLLTQYTQIRDTATFDDVVSDANTSAVAEPTVSGSLGDDMNVLRTIYKQIKGTTDWFGDLGNYFDPTNTDAGDTTNKDLNLTNIAGNTLDSKTVILAVENDNSGTGYAISTSDTGFVYTTGLSYATAADRRGLPIFESTTNSGSYFDEGGSDDVCVVDLIDTSTGLEFKDVSDNLIYAKFHDGADAPTGSGVGTDVWVRFYANDAPYTWTASDPSNISIILPYRKRMSDMEEYNWTRTDFVNGFEGDAVFIEDIQDLWSFTGASNGVVDPTWTNTSGYYPLYGDPTDLMSAIDDINDAIGDATYTSTYLSSGEDITTSLDALGVGIDSNDTAISTLQSIDSSLQGQITTNASNIAANTASISGNAADIDDLEAAVGSATGLAGLNYSSNNYVTDTTSLLVAVGALDAAVTGFSGQKYIEELVSGITAGVEHTTPATYTPDSTAGSEGNNMDIWYDGQLLAASTGANGVNADRDYSETTTSGVTFLFDIPSGENLVYIIRQ